MPRPKRLSQHRNGSSPALASTAFASETVICVEPDGTRKLVTIEVGRPEQISRYQARCPIALRGLYEDLGYVAGGSTLQALSLGLLLIGNLLTRFVQRGGRVLINELDAGDDNADQDFPFEAYFAPVDGAMSEDTATRSLVCLYASLVGRITPDMRAISFELHPEELVLWIYHDGPAPSEPNAGLDIEGLRDGFVGNPEVRVQLVRVDTPVPIRARGTLVFALRHDQVVQAVA